MAMLRLPTKASNGRANLHQGGIGTGVDLDTGKTNHAVLRNRSIALGLGKTKLPLTPTLSPIAGGEGEFSQSAGQHGMPKLTLLALTVFGLSGFTSLAYEVYWTRVLTRTGLFLAGVYPVGMKVMATLIGGQLKREMHLDWRAEGLACDIKFQA